MAFFDLVQNIAHQRVRVEQPTPELESFKDFDFLTEATKLLESKREIPIATHETVFRASGLSKMCPREEVLRHLHGVPKVEKISAKLQITFDFGTSFHNIVQNEWFGKWRWLVGDWVCDSCYYVHPDQVRPDNCRSCMCHDLTYREFEVLDREGVSGHTDGIIEKNGVRKLIEFKTCASQVYEFVTKMRARPLARHEDQTQIYLWLFNVRSSSVVYINKDTSEWVQFPKFYDEDHARRMVSKVQVVRLGIRKREAPPRTICEKIECARAKACPVKKICFAT